ncbi:hypothetical protein ACS0TY_024208 [Phlomoides rotata]
MLDVGDELGIAFGSQMVGMMKGIFSDDNNGSGIMLTIRLSDVASYPISDGTLVNEMKFMDEN